MFKHVCSHLMYFPAFIADTSIFWDLLFPQPFEPLTLSFALHHLCAMSSHQPPSEGSDTSFWASVYTQERPNVLCGVITDVNLHRFTLHQHLTTHRALTETPLLHPPFQQALPNALQTHIQLYTTSVHQIEIHLRRALTALEALGRHPPSVYLQELDSTLDEDSASEVIFQHPTNSYLGKPFTCHPLHATTLYPHHRVPESCNTLR